MSYLPGVPNMGPAPVSPTIKSGASIGKGKPTPGPSAAAHSVGKPGNTQHIGSIFGKPGAGGSSVGGGNPAAHSSGNYGKLLGGQQMAGGVDPTAHKGAQMIKGQSGTMRSHIREGGLGPGKMSTPGPSNTDYSMNSGDTE